MSTFSGTINAELDTVHHSPNPRVPARLSAIAAAVLLTTACVTRDPAVDTVDVITSPTPVATTPAPPSGTVSVAYTQDMAPIFQADCVRCHSGSRPDGNYSMATYELVLREVRAGDARSRLVTSTQNRGSMYRYWSGNPTQRAELTRAWVVNNNAARDR